jgi:hypothetical protein
MHCQPPARDVGGVVKKRKSVQKCAMPDINGDSVTIKSEIAHLYQALI